MFVLPPPPLLLLQAASVKCEQGREEGDGKP